MTHSESMRLLRPPLVFGDPDQIEAVRVIETYERSFELWSEIREEYPAECRIPGLTCDSCDGDGKCGWCGGSGDCSCMDCGHSHECDRCDGVGECGDCKGTGEMGVLKVSQAPDPDWLIERAAEFERLRVEAA